ncbi:hypothetical protein KFK09_017095 [Dendrobium nobile]|uniref:Uncharacterized protein n=1 Tax=Dendrobium nobile TaxID=94219 RepID=A0A8T3B210_DENNO|nr:hypothetical protein KFK09_017095 [Dendrobium nobile]
MVDDCLLFKHMLEEVEPLKYQIPPYRIEIICYACYDQICKSSASNECETFDCACQQ